jgi:biopolymer transport protein ExbB/TolQ
MLLTRVLSLRIIVIVAALSVVALVITLGAWVWFGVTNDQYSQLDRRLDSVSSLGDISTLLRNAQQDSAVDQPALNGGLVRTARVRNAIASVPSDIVLPQFDNGYANTTINGVEYRVRTFSAGVASIAVGAPLAETQNRIDELHRRVLLICGAVIVGTVLVGWVMWLIMINPFRLLAQQARAINAQSKPEEVQVRGVQEAVEIAEVVGECSPASATKQQRTRAAFESRPRLRRRSRLPLELARMPRIAHQPQVLSTLDLRDEQRKEVLGDVIRTQTRIEGCSPRSNASLRAN